MTYEFGHAPLDLGNGDTACITRDNNPRSAYVHVLADAFTSVLAIVALLAGRYLGWAWLDPTMGIVGAVVIGRWSWSLMRDTSVVLLDTTVHHTAERIRALVEGPGDASIYGLHVWRVGPEAVAGIVSVRIDEHIDTNSLRERLHCGSGTASPHHRSTSRGAPARRYELVVGAAGLRG